MSTALQQRLFNVDEYHWMAKAGIFSEEDRIELIEGAIVTMTPIGPPHSGTVNRLTQLFINRLAEKAVVSVQNPVRLDSFSEPQPDFAVLKPKKDFYSQELPGPTDVLWLVEIAEASVKSDREIKAPLYAKAGIPEYWLVDLPARAVEVCRDPDQGRYQSVSRLEQGESIRPGLLPETEFHIAEILG